MTNRRNTGGEVFLEFIPVGNSVKVSAVDAATGIEVSIIGPATAARDHLQTVALQKLRRRLEAGEG